MIKNLVTSGCSFTEGNKSWGRAVCNQLQIPNFFNMGTGAAGNRYIANSTIDLIQHKHLKPEDTLVLVMWSGPARIDELVSGEYWYLLSDYVWKSKFDDFADAYWVHSGGRANSWQDHHEVSKLFRQKYIVADPFTLCKQTLANILQLENFLKNQKFEYKFMSFVNYWLDDCEQTGTGEFSLPYFANQSPSYQSIDFDRWIFVNEKKDCLYEFCSDNGFLDEDGFHPSSIGHQEFAKTIIIPQLNSL